MLISEFYKDQVLFVTGGSGFIGKALVEKLLRSCPDIAKIYMLMRAKTGKTAQERLEATLKDSCFRQLWQERPEVFNKVEAIEGDCCKLNLGISLDDLNRMRNVSIIIHSAATVRFDEPLREAIFMNTRGTRELLQIAVSLRYLKAFVHISTTYSNPAENEVHEKIYESLIDWRYVIKFAENIDEDMLDVLTKKIGEKFPNTYTFTKNLSELIVLDYKDKLPISIFRPSIVTSSLEEPIPGWVENVNGVMGTLTACGTGLKRSDLCDPNVILALVPVDIVVRGIIITAYKIGIENMPLKSQSETEVYNCVVENSSMAIKTMIRTGEHHVTRIPFEKTLWLPGGFMHETKLFYLIQVFIQQVTFAIVLDGLLRLSGKKPKIVKLQRIFVNASKALKYFMFKTWNFKTEKFFALENCVSNEEKETFGFLHLCKSIDIDLYFPKMIYGIREFLLDEPREPTPKAFRRMKIFKVLHYIVEGIFVFTVLRFLYLRIFKL